MKNKSEIKEIRSSIIKYVQKNPKATFREINKNIKSHPERYFNGGIKEIYKLAKIRPPRTFKRKNIEQRQKIIIEYIQKNPKAGGHTIRKDTKIDLSCTF